VLRPNLDRQWLGSRAQQGRLEWLLGADPPIDQVADLPAAGIATAQLDRLGVGVQDQVFVHDEQGLRRCIEEALAIHHVLARSRVLLHIRRSIGRSGDNLSGNGDFRQRLAARPSQ
jgi:hypothetical protein